MKIYLLLLLLIVPIAYGLEECQRVMTASDIPCNIISSWNPGTCTDYTAQVYNSSGTLIQNLTWGDYFPVCNTTFNISTNGVYSYNSSVEAGLITIEGDSNMIYLLFIPLALCFLFLYWGNSLEEDHTPLKWFMRLLSLFMVFTIYAGADIIIAMNESYSGLAALFNIQAFTWIFYTVFAVFVIYFIARIFLSMANQKKSDFENGILR